MNNAVESDEQGVLLACLECGQRNRLKYERLGQTGRCGKCHTELRQPDVPVDMHNEKAFDALVAKSALPVLVDFWAPWCGPCKIVAPEVAKVATEGAGRWIVGKINTEELHGLAQRFRVTAIPMMALFKGGRERARQTGAMPAQAILQFLQQAL